MNLAIVYSLRGGKQLNKFNTVTHRLPANNQHFVEPPTCLGGVKRHGGHWAGVTKLAEVSMRRQWPSGHDQGLTSKTLCFKDKTQFSTETIPHL